MLQIGERIQNFSSDLLLNAWEKTMNGKFLLIGRNQIGNSFKTLVDRKIRERNRDERQLAE